MLRALVASLLSLTAVSPSWAMGPVTRTAVLAAYQRDASAETYAQKLVASGCREPQRYFRKANSSYIISERGAGNWGSQDALYLLATSDSCTASVNVAQPALYKITWNGTVTFSVQKGLNSDGTTGYGDTGVGESSLVFLTQNNCHLEVWANSASRNGDVGTGTTGHSNIVAQANKTSRCTSATNVTDTNGGATAGLHYVDRTDSSHVTTGLNGAVQSNGVASTSSALVANNVTLCKSNTVFCATNANVLEAGFGAALPNETAHFLNTRNWLAGNGVSNF